jgi:putative flippase GtrA
MNVFGTVAPIAGKPKVWEAAAMRSELSLARYARFFIVGTVVGLLTIGLRELIALALPSDTPLYYSLSVLVVYALGTLASYVLHHGFTFESSQDLRNVNVFLPFVFVGLVGAASTWALSLFFRYGLEFGEHFGRLDGAAAFALAAVLSSALTYMLNALLVFRRH